ncbi:UvrD-helicase domain-containing protein, partial [Candidatus Desantisbacteria bacterium]|nr:UvrD-helicase domain-containing protein [Candidatus Desantisbacteria bacterium]
MNLKQREAVEDTDGPLIIIAGAGTGKTRVITEKILHLIDNKKIAPRNILALTFSNRAASEMQDRVNTSLSSYYYDLEITTFHAFCNRILQEYGFHIGIPVSFTLLDNISQIIFMQKIYEKLNLNYYYSLSSPLSTLSAFTRFFSRCKDEIVSPSDFMKFVNLKENNYKNKMETLSEEEKASCLMELEELKERANVYNVYQVELTNAGYMDFNDLILNSISLFKKRPQILSRFQERFKYILVDEFQDTNIAQIELLKMLAGKYRNISVVGDDDQSIYHFRGASYASFIRFNEIFPDAKKITLNQNYRSTDKILKLANEVINLNASSRFDPDKKLFTEKKEGKKINILTAGDYIFEAKIIAEKIKNIYCSLSDDEKKWENFAVLYRAHSHKDKLVDVFKKENIPFQIKGSLNLFSNPKVKNLVALLKVIQNPDDSINMFKVLSELCSLSWEDKLYLNQISKQKEISLFQTINLVLQSHCANTFDKTLFIPLSEESIKNLNAVKNRIGTLFEKALEVSLQEIFFEILKKSGDIEKLYVREFFSLITDFIENNPESKLKEFIEYVEVFDHVGGTTPSENLPEIAPAVQMMSIHACKGLEFPYVFVIGLVSRRFPATEKEDLISLPDELIKGPIPEGDYHIQEERRLFYVALTRACKELYFTCIEKKRSPASVFIQEIKKM